MTVDCPESRAPGWLMDSREQLNAVLDQLPADRIGQVLDFARFLVVHGERAEWQRFGRSQLPRAYGDDEPDYTDADLKAREMT
jgi:hypothetical protein